MGTEDSITNVDVQQAVVDNTVAAEKPAPAPSGYLRLRGLPYAAGDMDIRDFFNQSGFNLSQVFVCKRNGRSTGEAYVQLADIAQAGDALEQMNRKHMGHRYIEVFEAHEADMTTAKALSQDRLKGHVVRLRGLPYNASASDVLKFLDGIEVVRGIEGVIFTWTPDGRPTGEAFVELQDEEGQREAMKRHKELMGTRYIELFTSTKADLIQAIQHNRLILGFASRKRWLQQAGLGGQVGTFMGGAGPRDMQHGGMGGRGGFGMGGGMMRQGGELDAMFAGMNLGSGRAAGRGAGAGFRGQGGAHQGQGGPRPTGSYNVGMPGAMRHPGGQLPLRTSQNLNMSQQQLRTPGFQQPNSGSSAYIPLQVQNNRSNQAAVLMQQPQYLIQQGGNMGQGMQYADTQYTPMGLVQQQEYYGQQQNPQFVGTTTPGGAYTLVLQQGGSGLAELGQTMELQNGHGHFDVGALTTGVDGSGVVLQQ